MAIADELKKLKDLHTGGALTDEEYARAKEAVLDAPPAPPGDDDGLPPHVGRPSDTVPNRFMSFQMIATVVTLVAFIGVFILVFLPRLEKGRDDLNRFRQESEQRKQQEELRKKSRVGP